MKPHLLTVRQTTSVVAVLVVVLTLAACGSASKSKSSSSSPASSAASAPTHGSIAVGYANTQGKGAESYPTYTVGVELAIKWINEHGGVNGRRLSLDTCFNDGTPASSVTCANQFVTHHDPVVLDGVDFGVDAMVPRLNTAGIPMLGNEFEGPKSEADPRFFQITTPLSVTLTGLDLALAKQHVKRFAFVDVNAPIDREIFNGVIESAATKLGMRGSPFLFDPASPNYTSVVAALKADGEDGVMMNGSEEECTAFLRTLLTSGYRGSVLTACTQFINALGKGAAGVESVFQVDPPLARAAAPAAQRASLDQYVASLTQAGDRGDVNDVNALYGYVTTMVLAQVLRAAPGPVTAATTAATFKRADLRGFDGVKLDCEHRTPAEGASCNSPRVLLKVTPSGKLGPVDGGSATTSTG